MGKIHYNLKTIEGQEAFNEIIEYFLGKDWYVVDPLRTSQVNAIALDEIKSKYYSKEMNFKEKIKWLFNKD